MNKTVVHYLSELLFLHDCVILPNFGGFVGNPKSASLNKTTGILTPPSKQIVFNTNLKTNDGLLITHISNQEGVTQDTAKNKVIAFATDSLKKLKSSKVLRMDKIGLFTLGKEGNIIFLQDNTTNYSLDSFGMQATHNKSISRVSKVQQRVMPATQDLKKFSPARTFLRAAAVIIPLTALSYLSISQQDRINNTYTQMANMNLFAIMNPNNTISPIVEEENDYFQKENTVDWDKISKELDEEEVIVNKTTNKEAPKEISTTKKDHYYIIGGAFAEKKNANRMLAKLNNWDYNAEILKEGKLLKVSYASFNNREDAVLALNKIRQQNSSAWLLKK